MPLPGMQALQYVQAHPDEVCPAGWKPGELKAVAGLCGLSTWLRAFRHGLKHCPCTGHFHPIFLYQHSFPGCRRGHHEAGPNRQQGEGS